jgi:hypothetical protein
MQQIRLIGVIIAALKFPKSPRTGHVFDTAHVNVSATLPLSRS